MKVIFLDIDGVLNSYATQPKDDVGKLFSIHPPLAARWAKLLRDTGAVGVLSSSWRHDIHWKQVMFTNGVAGLIDRTPELRDRIRGEEIDAWLAEHPQVTAYAILDDDSDMLPHQPHFLTSIHSGGLTEEIAERVRLHFLL